MLSHKQRNDWCTVVSAHLGEQIDVEISNNNSFHLMHAEHAGGWCACIASALHCTSDDSISKYNLILFIGNHWLIPSLVSVGNLNTGFWRSHRDKFVTYHKHVHVPVTLMLTSSLVSRNYFCTCGSLPSAARVFQQALTVESNPWTTPLVLRLPSSANFSAGYCWNGCIW